MSIIKSKRRRPESLGYNSWVPLQFQPITLAASTAPTVVEARYPLGLNHKIVAVSYVFSGSVAGAASMNIVQGAGTYETAGSSSFGTLLLGGTFVTNDKIIVNVGTAAYTVLVSARNAGNNQMIAASVARSLNKNAAFSASYVANSSGAYVAIQTLAYSTAGNATTLTTSTVSAAGTSTASGATLTGGTAGTVPTVPVNDTTQIGIVPPTVATNGKALFPVDMVLVPQADVPSTMYPASYDAIFASCTELTVRLATNGSAAGTLQVVLWAVPVDVHPMSPEERNEGFLPGLTII